MRAAKDIKIQFHTHLFKLYHSTTIKEHANKKSINQYTNTSITNKIIYKKNILVILEHKLVY